MSEAAITIRGLRHRYVTRGRVVEALAGIDLDVANGRFVSIVGPSGCGKSTLLKVLAGLLVPFGGEAKVHGESVVGRPGRVAYMPQRDLLLPWRKALANAALGAELSGKPQREARDMARELFPVFGLSGFENAWPSQLSGGMRQRLALLRTFLVASDVMALDEPMGALDAITRSQMHGWLQDVLARERRTVLFVTHDVEEALVLSDEVHVMTPRPGRLARCVEAPWPRPRVPGIVTTREFVERKAELLAALETDRTRG